MFWVFGIFVGVVVGVRGVGGMGVLGDITIFVFNASSPVSGPLGRAVRDVRRDMFVETGARAPMVSPGALGAFQYATNAVAVVFGSGDEDWIASTFASYKSQCWASEEAHCVIGIDASASPLMVETVLVVGEGSLGAIFAAYTFSEQVLGVDAWVRFSEVPPPFTPSGIPLPSSLNITFGSPVFTRRTWFFNDEDLTSWHWSDPVGENVWSLDAYDRFYETALRMKIDTVLPATNPFPDEKCLLLAKERGLYVTQHHYDLVGSNVFAWPFPSSSWNLQTDAQAMGYLWEASVAAQASPSTIYSIGLRGTNDFPYPCNGDAACAAAINDAMSNQTAYIDKYSPQSDKITYLWDEGLSYLESNLLHPPANTHIVFGDQGAGYIHGNASLLAKYAEGVYTHSAMYNGEANQLSEMIPASRILEQFLLTFMANAKALYIGIINVSDLRPVMMTTTLYSKLMYDPSHFLSSHSASTSPLFSTASLPRITRDSINPNTTALSFYHAWSGKYGLQGDDQQEMAQVWQGYFMTPLIFSGKADNFLAGAISSGAEDAANDVSKDGKVSSKTMASVAKAAAECDGTTAIATSLLHRATSLLPSIPPANLPFFHSHALTSLHNLADGCTILTALNTSVHSPSLSSMLSSLQPALNASASLKAARQQGQMGSAWSGYFRGDYLSDFNRAIRGINAFSHVLENGGKGVVVPIVPPHQWYEFEHYQAQWSQNYPFLYHNSTWNMNSYVRIHCVSPDNDKCANRPDGGRFRNGGGVVEMLFGPAGGENDPSISIKYTTDNTPPSLTSKTYKTPLTLQQDTTIQARLCYHNSTLDDVIAIGTWKEW